MEIWSKIFGYLDFETVQKTATLVCKLWFDMIRNDSVLSGELVLNSIQQVEIDLDSSSGTSHDKSQENQQ